VVLDDWFDQAATFFLKGTDQDYKKWKQREEFWEREIIEGRTIWDRLENEPEGDRARFSRHSLDAVRNRAMARIAKQHKANFESDRIEDPMGIALNVGFGLGLGFGDIKNITELVGKDPVKPSPRFLQIRAAQAAINRYNLLRDVALTKEILEKDLPPSEKEQKKKERDKRDKAELQYIAKRLSELVPLTSDPELFNTMGVQKMVENRPLKYRKISEHEMLMLRDDPIGMNVSTTELAFAESSTKIRRGLNISMSPSATKLFNDETDTNTTRSDDAINDFDDADSINKESGIVVIEEGDDDNDDWEPEIIFV
jgi:hypothetical protein